MEPFEGHPFVKWQKEWRGEDSLDKKKEKKRSWTKRKALYSKPSIFHVYNLGQPTKENAWFEHICMKWTPSHS
jgi:hypothetical protein